MTAPEPFAPAAAYDLAPERPDRLTRPNGYGPTLEAAETALVDLVPGLAADHGLTLCQTQTALDVLLWVWDAAHADGRRLGDRRYNSLPARPAHTGGLFGDRPGDDEGDEYDRHAARLLAAADPLADEIGCDTDTADALVRTFLEVVFPVALFGTPELRAAVAAGPRPSGRAPVAAGPAALLSRIFTGGE